MIPTPDQGRSNKSGANAEAERGLARPADEEEAGIVATGAKWIPALLETVALDALRASSV